MTTIFTKNELGDIAKKILEKVSFLASSRADVVTLSGDLGAGKTTLSQSAAKELGVVENVISPTFVIMKSYEIKNKNYKWKNLVHIDAYRLAKSEELLKLGWEKILSDKNNLILIEWSELVPECIPDGGVCRVNLKHVDEERRELEIML
ncbi:MAG: tRNA (adenosine(37)-N6)-threonylcarbamoyltransferase complex ATPase subunit type 1 TsaE [Candidatus Paceibacterota bacterium]